MGCLLKKSHSASALMEDRMDGKKQAGRSTDNYGTTEILQVTWAQTRVWGEERRGKVRAIVANGWWPEGALEFSLESLGDCRYCSWRQAAQEGRDMLFSDLRPECLDVTNMSSWVRPLRKHLFPWWESVQCSGPRDKVPTSPRRALPIREGEERKRQPPKNGKKYLQIIYPILV